MATPPTRRSDRHDLAGTEVAAACSTYAAYRRQSVTAAVGLARARPRTRTRSRCLLTPPDTVDSLRRRRLARADSARRPCPWCTSRSTASGIYTMALPRLESGHGRRHRVGDDDRRGGRRAAVDGAGSRRPTAQPELVSTTRSPADRARCAPSSRSCRRWCSRRASRQAFRRRAGRPDRSIAVQTSRQALRQARCARHRDRQEEVHDGPGRAGCDADHVPHALAPSEARS